MVLFQKLSTFDMKHRIIFLLSLKMKYYTITITVILLLSLKMQYHTITMFYMTKISFNKGFLSNISLKEYRMGVF